MRFFRGLSVGAPDLDVTIAKISAGGLRPGDGKWLMDQAHPGSIEELFEKTCLSTEDTRGNNSLVRTAVCACGDPEGAAYYAWQHNRTRDHDTPVMVEFEADIEAVAVDGRDFLYTVFQMGEPERARGVLERCFGRPVLRYAERAWQTDDQQCRVALCDLAIHDPMVVEAHHASQTVVRGRHGTTFRSAFTVALPVDGACIVRVSSPMEFSGLPRADVHLDDVVIPRTN